jgi:eukaryotic-like serine/threonine-protein kinase
MPVTIRCPSPNCGQLLSLGSTSAPAGAVRCPKCKQVFVPSAAVTQSLPPPASPAPSPRVPPLATLVLPPSAPASATPPVPRAAPPAAVTLALPPNVAPPTQRTDTQQNAGAETPTPMPVPPAEPLPTRIGRFQIRRFLGEGGFGRVYEAYDPQLDRLVALKVAKAEMFQSEDRVKRFLGEARAAANLRHPNIVPVYDSGRDGNVLYIASAFIPGQSLDATLAEQHGQGLEPTQAASIVRKLADALAYAHAKGVVHRDVKPANVMLDETGEPLLTDFGLAARIEGEERLTQEKAQGLGTPAYMAPEQGRGQAVPASDQYSLGCTLFEFLTGQTPFAGPPELQLFLHQSQAPPALRKVNPRLPRDLETIALKCLEKEPGRRYANCGELSDDLRRWQDGLPIGARRLSLPERVWRWAKREPRLAVASAVAVLALLGALVIQRVLNAQLKQETALKEQQRDKAINALAQKEIADAQKAIAEKQEKLALAQKERRYQSSLYANDLRQVEALLAQREPRKAEQVLGATSKALRGWEWFQLKQRCQEKGGVSVVGDGRFWAVAVSPDGQWLACGGEDLRVCNLLRQGEVIRLVGHTGLVRGVAISPDGKRLASASEDQTVRVWDVASRRQLFSLSDRKAIADTVAFSPDGRSLVTGNRKGAVTLWDASNGQQRRQLAEPTGKAVFAVAFSPNGTRIAAGGEDLAVQLWNARTGEAAGKLAGPTGTVYAIAFSPDSGRLVAAGKKAGSPVALGTPPLPRLGVQPLALSELHLWDLARGGSPRVFTAFAKQGPRDLFSVAFTPDGKSVVAGGVDITTAWNAATGAVAWELKQRGPGVAISPEGEQIFLAGDGVHLWRTQAGADHLTLPGNRPSAVAFSADGAWVGAACKTADKGEVRVWNARTGALRHAFSLGDDRFAHCVAFSPDGKRLAVGLSRLMRERDHALVVIPVGARLLVGRTAGEVRLWDLETGESLPGSDRFETPVAALAFAPDGTKLFVGLTWEYTPKPAPAARALIKILDGSSLKELRTIDAHPQVLCDLAVSPDGRQLASCGGKGLISGLDVLSPEVKLWDTATGKEALALQVRDDLRCIAISPDSRYLACGGSSGIGHLIEAATGKERFIFRTYGGEFNDIAFTANGERIVTADRGSVRLWDAATGQELLALPSPGGDGMAVDPRGKRIAAGAGESVRVWSSGGEGRERLTLTGHSGKVQEALFAARGRQVVSISDQEALVWDASSGQKQQTVKLATNASEETLASTADRYRLIRPPLVDLSADGRRLASLETPFSLPGQVVVWDAATGRQQLRLPAHAARANAVAISPDGKHLASCGVRQPQGGELRVWDLANGKPVVRAQVEMHASVCLAWSPDGSRIAVGGASITRGFVEVHDARSGALVSALRQEIDPVCGVAFTPDGKYLITGSGIHFTDSGFQRGIRRGQVILWDASTGNNVRVLHERQAWIRSLALCPDGRLVATGDDSGSVLIHEVASGQRLHTLKGRRQQVRALTWSLDGKRIASGTWFPDAAGELKVWDAETGNETYSLEEPRESFTAIAFGPDGKTLATLGEKGTLVMRDAATGKERSRREAHLGEAGGLCFGPGGVLVTCGRGGPEPSRLLVRELAGGKVLLDVKLPWDRAGRLLFSADAHVIAVAGWQDGRAEVRAWDLTGGKAFPPIPGPPLGREMALSPNGNRLVIVAGRNTHALRPVEPDPVAVWDLASGKKRFDLDGHRGLLTSVTISPDGRLLGAADANHGQAGELCVWDMDTGKHLKTLPADSGRLVRVTPRGSPSRPRVTDIRTGKEVQIGNPIGRVTLVAFSPDGGRLASVHAWPAPSYPLNTRYPEEVRVWDVAGQLLLSKLVPGPTLAAAFSPKGNRLALACQADPPAQGVTGTADLWLLDVATGRVLFGLRRLARVSCLRFSPDGTQILAGSADGTIRLWDATGQDENIAQNLVPDEARDPKADEPPPPGQTILKAHTGRIMALVFSPDSTRLASAADATVCVWDPETGRPLHTLQHAGTVRCLAFSPDGKHLAAGGGGNGHNSGELRLWDPATGKEVLTIEAGKASVGHLAWAPDGKLLAGTLRDGINVWDVKSGKLVRALSAGSRVIFTNVGFTPDGKRVRASAAAAGTMHWDLDTGRRLLPPAGPLKAPVRGRTASADGRWLAVAQGNTIRLIRLGVAAVADPPPPPPTKDARGLIGIDAAWHRQQANLARASNSPFAEDFHLQCLLALKLGEDPELLARRLHLLAQVMQDDPGDEWAVLELARTAGWFPEAVGDLPGLLATLIPLVKNREDAGTLRVLGGLQFRVGNTKQAVATLEKALKQRDPGGPPVEELLLCLCHRQLGQAEAADRYLAAAVAWIGARPPIPDPRLNPLDWQTAIELRRLRAEAERR